MTTLGEIRVLWRRPDTMELWGIPYSMRPGQSPRDLYEGRRVNTSIPSIGRYESRSAPGVREDWIYLGAPRWWGHLTTEDQRTISSWLDLVTVGRPRELPQGPGEWVDLADLVKRQSDASVEPVTGAEEPEVNNQPPQAS